MFLFFVGKPNMHTASYYSRQTTIGLSKSLDSNFCSIIAKHSASFLFQLQPCYGVQTWDFGFNITDTDMLYLLTSFLPSKALTYWLSSWKFHVFKYQLSTNQLSISNQTYLSPIWYTLKIGGTLDLINIHITQVGRGLFCVCMKWSV